MVKIPAHVATLPGPLPEWDAQWSRLVTVDTVDGSRTFHVLDTLPALRAQGREPTGTILALHGNPTWSYLWRGLAAATLAGAVADGGAGAGGRIWRVIAPDQLDMGYSERLEHDALPTTHGTGYRRIAERVSDFDTVVQQLLPEGGALAARETRASADSRTADSPTGKLATAGSATPQPATPAHPIITIGHDWGGLLSLTWAARHPELVDAVISLNTGVHQPEGMPLPVPLRAALSGPMLPTSTVLTDWFLRTTLALGQGPLRPEIRDAFSSPYRGLDARGGIGGFVADIPATPSHPSYAELQQLGTDIAGISSPALLIWGPKDPVFVDYFLRDLRERLPQADLHRIEGASHLVSEDADVPGIALRWLAQQFPAEQAPGQQARASEETGAVEAAVMAAESSTDELAPLIFEALDQRAGDRAIASVDMSHKPPQQVTWRQLTRVVDGIARGLQDLGLQKGDRVSLLVTPGNTLTAVLYGVLKAGGVAVVADTGLGVAGMSRAIKAADPKWIIGLKPGLTLARAAKWPGRRLGVGRFDRLERAALGIETTINELSRTRSQVPIALPGPDDEAAVLYTSGSTGPAKGVRYTHARLGALARTLREQFKVHEGTGWVAGFAPFALLGPGLGISSVTPDMSVTKPRTLTAAALADAIIAGKSTMVFASPAAHKNVVATAGDLTEAQRASFLDIELVLSAGAPVPLSLMDQLAELFPNAEIRSPYGMTEGLMLTNIDRDGVAAAEAQSRDHGVCVGKPVSRVSFALAPLDELGDTTEELLIGEAAAGILGEFVVSAPHVKAGYDVLWDTDRASKRDALAGLTWHRTNDIGHFDAEGRVWLEGRLQHVLSTPLGPLAPGGVEAVVDKVPSVSRSAVVGVGPVGTQAVVVVLEPEADARLKPGIAPLELADAVRAAAREHYPHDIAAVLVASTFPTDIRHNSKIDRLRLATWADSVLRGETIRKP
ncbi:alpha/beta fold hydrolase [Gulosibacter chungangensis]|uniref:Alpha/beta fold hydrolase n=1 Tax=Gulosibacter chungangensis TaxID=979746 RepID=A0A7J5BFQ4_9MICO|nr:alpha/beta fold hydrolase [Gulosibacter chungangensis]KAB1645087.1 alpha/beta fold hydrolase [Gulosibacter chungangensis]